MSCPASLHRRTGLAAALVALVLTGCTTRCPPPCPIQPAALHAEVREERRIASRGDAIDLAEAASRMRRANPELRRARAAWREKACIAAVKTPRPNPTIEAGPLIFGGSSLFEGTVLGAAAMLGWTVELGPKRRIQDSVNALRADAAVIDLIATERELYLALRHEHAIAILGEDLILAQEQLVKAADEAQASMESAAEAGEATLLDEKILSLETAHIKTESYDVILLVEDARAAWRARIGAEADAELRPTDVDLPPYPEQLPDKTRLQSLVLRDHPDLARLRAEHQVAEKELRLESARAIPDLDIGGGYEYEVEGSKVMLPLGIEIPISDRNQPGIAAAMAHRSLLRERYAARLTELLADMEHARERLQSKRAKYLLLRTQLTDAKEMLDVAEETLRFSGALDMTRYLEIVRTYRRVLLEELQGRADMYDVWFDLEKATGAPLFDFPGAPKMGTDS